MALISRFIFPAGVCMTYAGANAPLGWLLCYGQAVSRATYKALFDAIGTTYGVGDGATTFNLPDVRGRAPFGKDDMGGVVAGRINAGAAGFIGANLGAVGGSQSTTLTTAQMPNHGHALPATLPASAGTGVSVGGSSVSLRDTTALNATANGSGTAHINMPPAIIFNYIISTGA